MSIQSGRIFSVGAVVVLAVTACGGNQTTIQTTPSAISSVHLSAQGTNYIGAESRMLTGFAIGVGNGKIATGSRVALSGGDNGVNASAQVWYGKSLQTARGFSLDYNSAYTSQAGAKHVRGSGNLFIASTASAPSLTATPVVPGRWQMASARLLTVQVYAASETTNPVFDVGSETGLETLLSPVISLCIRTARVAWRRTTRLMAAIMSRTTSRR